MRPLRRRVVKASLQLVVVAVEGVLRLDLISGSLSRYIFARAANIRVYYPPGCLRSISMYEIRITGTPMVIGMLHWYYCSTLHWFTP
jgi:hypothetical protein